MARPPKMPEPPSDTERFQRMTPEERLSLFLELCDLTDSIVAGRPDAEAIRSRAPRSAEAEALWQRLMDEGPFRDVR